MDNITQDKEIVKGDKMSDKKCKWTAPNGQERECKPSIRCTDCEYHPLNSAVFKYDGHEYEAIKDGIKYKSTDGENWVPETEELKNAYEAGKMLQYQKENGEWVDFSKNTVCDDFKFQKHLNYRIKPAYDHKPFSDKKSDGVYIRNHEYTKIQNYIEAIRLIAEKLKTAESDCIEQLARDVGNYLYDLVRGDE